MSRLDVCERPQEDLSRDGGRFCNDCGWEIHHHRPRPSSPSDALADDPKAIAVTAEALRIAEGRGKWSTDNLPGTDVARARAVLLAIDVFIANRRAGT